MMSAVFVVIALGGSVGLVRLASAAEDGSTLARAYPTAAPSPSEEPSPTGDPGETGEPTGTADPTGDPTTPPADPTASPGEPTATPSPTDHTGHEGTPTPEDFIPIAQAPNAAPAPAAGPDASTGTFSSRCGRNLNRHRNPDNFIVGPGVANAAHHTHDYVGNLSADRNSTDASLDASGTTCSNGDKSTYFWPVVRDTRRQGRDAEQPGGGQDGNLGRILTPVGVTIQFRGNAQSEVVAMPRFMRVITGDSKAITNGPNSPNARAQWACSGTRGKVSTTLYPLCPRGQLVQRISDFPSCWDGVNTDSANHRTHVVFPDAGTGACPEGTQAVPQLRITLSYDVPRGPNYALDSFPEQLRKAVTDHNDFVNVMSTALMNRAVTCINSGRRC